MYSGPFGFRYLSSLLLIIVLTALVISRAQGFLPMHLLPPITRFTLPKILALLFWLPGLYYMLRSDLMHIHLAQVQPHFSSKKDRLITIGPYAHNRHPYRSGYFLHCLGWFMWFRYPTLLALIIPMVVMLIWSLTFHFWEEQRLARKFGQEYADYHKRVPYLNWRMRLNEHERYPLGLQLAWLICLFGLRFKYGLRASRLSNIPRSGPFLIVANHESYFDPFAFGVFVPYPVYYVTTSDVYTSKWIKAALYAMRTFPIDRHRQDLKAIRTMLRLIDQNEVVCIFPEGGRSMDGAPQDIAPETLKLIKRCNVPILPVKIEGAYEIWPRWSDHRRKGKLRVEFQPIIEPEPEMELEELGQLIRENIFWEGVKFQKSKDKRLTPGIDKLLWGCIQCNSRECIGITGPRGIRCKECGQTWRMSDDYHLIPSGDELGHSVYAWLEILRSDISPFGEFSIETDQGIENLYLTSALQEYRTPEDRHVDPGVLYMTEKRIVLFGGGRARDWSYEQINVFTLDWGNSFSLGISGSRHTFLLPETETPQKWADTYAIIQEL